METASSSAPTAGVRDDQGERPHQLAAQAEPHSLGATSQGLETRSTRQGLETRAAATEPPRLGKNFTDTGASQNVGRPSNLSSASKVEESHSKAESMSIPIPSKPVSQPQSQPHSGEATSPSTPPHGPQTGTPPREGILSTAARAALEGRQSSRRDATCHSPSPSRRRPPLSPSSSSGGMTPPKPQGAPSPKPQKMFHNPYAKSPFRVTGFNPGSPRAPVPVTQLSAETENELLQATQRGLFSDDDVAESERSPRDSGGGFQSASGGLHESTAKAGGPSQRVEELGISGRGPGGFVTCEKGSENEPSDLLGTSPEMSKMDISGEDADAGESAVTRNEEAELESRKRKSEESPEKVRGGASGSMEVREQPDLKQPQLSSPIGKESEEEASHSGRISGTPYRQTDSAFLQTPHMTAAHPAAGLRSKQSEFQRATGNEPGEAEGRLPQAHSSLPPKPELSASSRVPSFDGGNKRSARDRWRRARLHVAAARAFAYGSGLGGFSEVTEPETSGAAFRTKLELAEEPLDAASPDSIVRSASITQPKAGIPAADVSRDRGRRRFEGIEVIEDRSWLVALSDLYIAVLKAPVLLFVAVIFLFPALLCLVFVPLYLLDLTGLQCVDCQPPLPSARIDSPPAPAATHSLCHVLLYSLSLSMLFGGSPVQAHSRYTLLVANLQTLVANFTFVFLSGAVFSRMSQRSQPVQCARKAVIRPDDVTTAGEGVSERFRVFLTRLVLKGPTPAVMVDVRIKLTFRIFVQQRNGSVFCSTAALDLVRPEVAYLQYGIAVKHVIDRGSPLYGHTRESLLAGDASFSLTVLGTERASLQSVFHMQEYFMSDGDIAWDGDFFNIVSIDSRGIRVIDHTQLDTISVFRSAAQVPRAITRMQNLARATRTGSKSSLVETEQGQEGDSTKDVDRVLDASQSGGVSGQTSASGNSERPNPGSSDGSKSHESGQAGSSAQLSSSPQESSVQKSSEPTKKAEEPARGEGGWKKLARRKEEVSTGGGKPGNEEETRRMVGDVLGGFSGPASDFGRGLSREALQSLRQRKIDKEGTAQSKVERSGESVFERGTGATARRYNAGF